jgi:hypothetical protein
MLNRYANDRPGFRDFDQWVRGQVLNEVVSDSMEDERNYGVTLLPDAN